MKPSANLQFLADQLLLQHFFSPAVLTNNKGDILYISGRTGKYIEPPAGKANWNNFTMTREGLRIELGSAFHKAIQGNKPVTVKCLNFETGDDMQAVDITVQAITEPEALRGMVIIIFTDVTATCKKSHQSAPIRYDPTTPRFSMLCRYSSKPVKTPDPDRTARRE